MTSEYKHEFVTEVSRVRVELDELLRQSDEVSLRQPGVEGEWSCADVLAHLSGYTRGVADELRRARGLSALSPDYAAAPGLSDDDFNAIVVGYWRTRSTTALLSEEREAFQALVAEVLRLPAEAIETPGWFRFTRQKSLREILPAQIHQHYADHLPAVRTAIVSVET